MKWDWDEFFERVGAIVLGTYVIGLMLTLAGLIIWGLVSSGLGWILIAVLALVIVAGVISAATMLWDNRDARPQVRIRREK